MLQIVVFAAIGVLGQLQRNLGLVIVVGGERSACKQNAAQKERLHLTIK